MPVEQTKLKSASGANSRQMTADRKLIDVRHSSPEKRTNAVTSAQGNRNTKTLRKVLQQPVKAKDIQGVSTPRPTRNLPQTQSVVAKVTSMSSLHKVSSQNPNVSVSKPPLPPSKRSNSVPAVKQKPVINSHQQTVVTVRSATEPQKQVVTSSSSYHYDKSSNEKQEVEKVVSSCNYENSSPLPLKIFPSFRGEYPTRHRAATGHHEWLQRTATHGERVVAMEIAGAGPEASTLPKNNEGCTTMTETHYLSTDCSTDCEPTTKSSCAHCGNVVANNRRYEEYPFCGDQQTTTRRRQAFTHQQLQQQQQQQTTLQPTFGNNWVQQIAAEQTSFNGFQQALPVGAVTPLPACSGVWSSPRAVYPETWQTRLQSGNIPDVWQSANGQPSTQSQITTTLSGQNCNSFLASKSSTTQKHSVSTIKKTTLSQTDMKALAPNEASQRQFADQDSDQLMQSVTPGGEQQPATLSAVSCTEQQACLQAQLLALRMTEQVQQQMVQTQQQIAQVQKQLESGKGPNEITELPNDLQTESKQEQIQEEEAAHEEPHPRQRQEQPLQELEILQEQLQHQELPPQQLKQQLPEGGMLSMLHQQGQTAGTSPFDDFNQGVDYFQALASQQTLMSLPTMGNPMIGQAYPLPFNSPQNGNFLNCPQPFPSGMMPSQTFDSGPTGQSMPVMSSPMPQSSFMGLSNGFPMPGLGSLGGNGGLMPMTPSPIQPNMYPYQNNNCYMPCYRPRCGNMRYMMPRWY